MSRIKLLSLQLLVAVVALAMWHVLTTVPVFGRILLPPFFFSNPIDVGSQIVKWFYDRRDLEAPVHHAVGIDPGFRDRLGRRRRWSGSGSRASRSSPRCSIPT